MCFATAHSRGLRLNLYARLINLPFLCHSAFARVATITIKRLLEMAILCHSAFVRVATVRTLKCARMCRSLPQRIRAGCDGRKQNTQRLHMDFATAHSCGLRRVIVEQKFPALTPLPQRIRAGCDPTVSSTASSISIFATAHSCGLRPATES